MAGAATSASSRGHELTCTVSEVRCASGGDTSAPSVRPSRYYIDVRMLREGAKEDGDDDDGGGDDGGGDGRCDKSGRAAVGNETFSISFRNHYVAWITIKAQLEDPSGSRSSSKWLTLIERCDLMRDVHCEGDATCVHTLPLELPHGNGEGPADRRNGRGGEQLCSGTGTTESECRPPATRKSISQIRALRLYLYQPSPRWASVSFSLTDISLRLGIDGDDWRPASPPSSPSSLSSFRAAAPRETDPFKQFCVPIRHS